MRNICYYIAIALFVSACGSDDDGMPVSDLSYLESGIEIVKQDGSPLDAFNCIDPLQNYAVRISVSPQGQGEITPTNVNYTVNGNTSSVTFLNPESKLINIEIVNGLNTVQLVVSGLSDTAKLNPLPEFEIVL